MWLISASRDEEIREGNCMSKGERVKNTHSQNSEQNLTELFFRVEVSGNWEAQSPNKPAQQSLAGEMSPVWGRFCKQVPGEQ